MLGRVKLDNTLLTCDQGNFSQIPARSQNRTLAVEVRDTLSLYIQYLVQKVIWKP